MRITYNIKDSKFNIDHTFSYEDLESWMPLLAALAIHDIQDAIFYQYTLIDGDIYAYQIRVPDSWWAYNQTFRTWNKIDKPVGAK